MLHRAHHEGKARRLAIGLLEQGAVIGAEQAQVIRAAALHEAQIIGVIDNAGEIRVLVVHPHRHGVASPSHRPSRDIDSVIENLSLLLGLAEQVELRGVARRLGQTEVRERHAA